MTDDVRDENIRSKLLKRIGATPDDPPWQMSDALMTLVALALAMMLIAPTIASGLSPSLAELTPEALLLGWSVGAVIVSVFVLIGRRSTLMQQQALKLKSSGIAFFYPLMIGVSVALIADLLAGFIGGFRPVAELSGIRDAGWLIGGLFLIVLQPIAEGLVYQAVVLPRLRASFGAWQGFFATVGLFVLLRVLIYGTGLTGTALMGYGMVMPFFMGLSVSAMRLYTDSTRDAVIMQMGAGLTLLLIGLALTG